MLETCLVTAACGQGGRTPCAEVWSAHDEKLRLGEVLEAFADALPSHLDRMKCLQVANELVPLLRDSHHYEEETVFPAFEKGSADAAAGAASVRRLKTEHVEDECAAQDITDMLLAIGHPESLGLMLRAFFDTLRRHIAFEREHVLPLLGPPL